MAEQITIWLGDFSGRFVPLNAPDDLPVSRLSAILHVIVRSTQASKLLLFNPALGEHLPADSEQSISDFCVRHGSALLIVPEGLPKDVCAFMAGQILGQKYRAGRSSRALEDVEDKIERVIAECKWTDENIDPSNNALWVLKFFGPRYLDGFLNSRQLLISTAPGFTWGDAVYVTPLRTPCSTMMYGRAGVMGYIKQSNAARVFRADAPTNLRLYQQWITYHRQAFTLLTTTIHSNLANRALRNRFRRRFRIDVVLFAPDQSNRDYVDRSSDLWLAVSDWGPLASAALTRGTAFTQIVEDCRWVAIVGDEFEAVGRQVAFRNYFGEHSHKIFGYCNRTNQTQLINDLRTAYASGNNEVVFVETS